MKGIMNSKIFAGLVLVALAVEIMVGAVLSILAGMRYPGGPDFAMAGAAVLYMMAAWFTLMWPLVRNWEVAHNVADLVDRLTG